MQGNVPLAAGAMKLFARRRGLEEHFRIELLPPALANVLGDQGLVEEILGREPWMVGFTCYLWNIERTLWVINRLKERRPDLRVALGGPEITPDNRWVLDRKTLDYAIFGEGEPTLAELLDSLRSRTEPLTAIAGLWTAAAGALLPERASMPELDAVSSPYLEGILDAADEQMMLLETVRGCRFRCRYCYYPKSHDALAFLSPAQIAACLHHAEEKAVSEVVLLDPTLNQRPDFADFLRGLARGNPQRQFTFSGELRAEGIDAAAAALLAQANFKEVEIGLQSIDPRAQELMGRRTNLKALESGVKALLDAGIEVRLDLILGLPGDTVDSIRRGLDYLERVHPFSTLQVFHLSILPGTEFRRQAAELGLEFQSRPPYYVLKTPTLDVQSLRALMAEAQEVFGVEFDPFPPPQLGLPAGVVLPGGTVAGCCLNLDLAKEEAATALPPAAKRSQAFTLWLRGRLQGSPAGRGRANPPGAGRQSAHNVASGARANRRSASPDRCDIGSPAGGLPRKPQLSRLALQPTAHRSARRQAARRRRSSRLATGSRGRLDRRNRPMCDDRLVGQCPGRRNAPSPRNLACRPVQHPSND